RTLHSKGPISKPAIARELGLTSASVHKFINELLDEGVVVEDGTAQSMGGRRAALYNINASYGYLLGQDITHTQLSTYVYNIKLNLLYEAKALMQPEYNLKGLGLMYAELKKALTETAVPKDRCFGIGVSVPGLVDYHSGVVHNIPILRNWHNVPMKNYLQERLGILTLVDNNVNAMVLADKWVHDLPGNGLVAVSISRGVGAGVITRDAGFRGAKSTAGEIGHTTIRFDGIPCTCGNNGCLDTYVRATEKTLIRKVEQRAGLEIGEMDHLKVSELMEREDTYILDVMDEFAEYVSIALDHIYKLYAPGCIVVHSDWLMSFRDLRYRIVDNFFARNNWLQHDEVQVLFLGATEHLRYAGAVLVLDHIFNTEQGLGGGYFQPAAN
ncbi:MAG: ROK family transcriptional regulator, partial [Clostridia bacterium]|nr:ROK family transcriptional regulator [Clostridia bacterium]